MWRRANQQHEVAEEEGHVLLPTTWPVQGQQGRADHRQGHLAPRWRSLAALWRGGDPTSHKPEQPQPKSPWDWWPQGRWSSGRNGEKQKGDKANVGTEFLRHCGKISMVTITFRRKPVRL